MLLKTTAVSSRAIPTIPLLQILPPKTSANPQIQKSIHQTLDSLLQKCSSMEQLKQLHAQLITNDLLSETLLVGKLIAFCSVSNAGDLNYGRRVFDRVADRNRFMWNNLIRGYSNNCNKSNESLNLFCRMLRSGVLPNHFTLPFLLKLCAELLAYLEALMIHALIFKLGFESQVYVMNALINAYGSCGSLGAARKVFDQMWDKNIVSWNSMIGGYCRLGECDKAFGLFEKMREACVAPDGFTLVSLLSVCAEVRNLELGRVVHHYMVMSGVSVDLILGNVLLDMYGRCGELFVAHRCFERMTVKNVVSWTSMVCAYAKCGLIDAARGYFVQMPDRNIVSWNTMISCYVQHGFFSEALDLYTQMEASGILPDEVTMVCVLSACSQTGDFATGKKIHNYIYGQISSPGVALLNSLVDMHAKCGFLDNALNLFNMIPQKSVVSWNVIIGALAMHGRGSDAVKLFRCMVDEGFSPDTITFTVLLSACSHGGLLEFGHHYFDNMSPIYKVSREIEHYACMIDLLGRVGKLEQAIELIHSMPMKPDVVIWGALLGACRIHGNIRIGQVVMKHLLELGSDCGGLYTLMSNMYSEFHRWNNAKTLRKLMKGNGIKKVKANSIIEINNYAHEFVVEDMAHESSNEIYTLLDLLTDHMTSDGQPSVCLKDFCFEEQ